MRILVRSFLLIVLPFFLPIPHATAQEEAVTVNTIEPIKGDLSQDKPNFPSFYIWRRVYQHKGKSVFKPYLVKSDGSYIQDPAIPNYSSRIEPRFEKRQDLICLNNEIASATSDSKVFIPSDDGRWSLIFDGSDDNAIRYRNNLTSKVYKFGGSEEDTVNEYYGETHWNLLGWAPNHDLFYRGEASGTTDMRANVYFQFDPKRKTQVSIGIGQELFISDDGNWVVWVDGGPLDFGDRQIHIYDIEKNRDYTIYSGHSDNAFYKWAVETDHISEGKKFYLKHQYLNAVSEYRRALVGNPQDAETYGLMGYSYYRNGQLDAAVNTLQQSLQINPKTITSHYNLALVYWAQSQKNKSIEEINQIYLLDPTYKKQIYDDTQFKTIIHSPEYQELEKKFNP